MNRSYSQVVSLAGGGLGRISERSCEWGQSIWSLRCITAKPPVAQVPGRAVKERRCQSEWQPTALSEIKGDAMVLLSVEKYYFRGSEGYENPAPPTVAECLS